MKIRKIGLKSCKNFSNIGPTSMVLTKKKNKKQKHKITIVWNGKWEMGKWGKMGENGGKISLIIEHRNDAHTEIHFWWRNGWFAK